MGIAAAVAGAGVLGAGASLYGSSQQADAAKAGINEQQQMFQILQGNLAPYMQTGQQSLSALNSALPGLTAPFNPANLASTPGYQFTLQQGMNAVNNSNSTKGWGQSGPGAKAIADYTTGLASSTYNQQFQNYWNQNQSIYNMLLGPAQLGESAAAGVGSGALSTGQGIASSLAGGANAQAAGAVGASNSLTNGVLNYALLSNPNSGGAAASPDINSIMLARYGFNPLTSSGGGGSPGIFG